MEKTGKILKTLLLLVLALSMACICVAAGADDDAPSEQLITDKTKTGSITVTKYVSTADGTQSGAGNPTQNPTGTTADKTHIDGAGNKNDPKYFPLHKAEFNLYPLYTTNDAAYDAVVKYYKGDNNGKYTISADGKKVTYEEGTTQAQTLLDLSAGTPPTPTTKVTGEDGVCTFSDLPIGIYLLTETPSKPSNQITTISMSNPCLISIPMVNTSTSNNNSHWMYDINVYPKNLITARAQFELTKVDQDNTVLQGVEFQLEGCDLDKDGKLKTTTSGDTTTVNWVSISDATTLGADGTLNLTTGADGKIGATGLPANTYGVQYRLTETFAPAGYILDKTPIYFIVHDDGTITWNPTDPYTTDETKKDINGLYNVSTAEYGHTLTDNTPYNTTPAKLAINVRNELPSLTKKVKEHPEGTAAGNDPWKQDTQYRLTNTIEYKITVYVPRNVEQLETFEIIDNPLTGIADVLPSSIMVGGTNVKDYFNIDRYPEEGTVKGFRITLDKTELDDGHWGDIAGKTITILYDATFTDKAEINGKGNENTATLTYSRYIPEDTTETNIAKYTIADRTRVYTYSFQLTKYKDSKAEANLAENVEFELRDAENGDALRICQVKGADGQPIAGEYRLALPSGETEATKVTMVTNEKGLITINGLDNGDYYLKETKTIEGYNLLSGMVKVTVNVAEVTQWKAVPFADGDTPNHDAEVHQYERNTLSGNTPELYAMHNEEIINKKGFVLPQTGSMGYLVFCAAGLLLMTMGMALILSERKKKIR